MNLTSEQRDAINSDSPDILLSAGAGSGKTSTTVHRYERLLTGEYTDGRKGEPVEPSSILVFTFTDKAAGELRDRIRSLRDQRNMTFSMGNLWVGTFHSICARILRGHPVAATVDPAFEVIDDVVASRIKEAAYAAALERSCEKEETVALLSRFTASTLKKGIQSAYERLRAAGEFKPRLPEPKLQTLEEIQRGLLREALSVQSDESLKPGATQRANNVIAALKDLNPDDLTLEVLEGIDIYANSSQIPHLCRLMRNAKVELKSREIGPPYHEALSALLVNYGEEYEAAKTRRGGLDFEDLQLKTLDLLLRRPEIAAVYREQFVEIMVDEFQDTNLLQMDLIDQLRGEGTTLFTVGDEMQAIYGFRYADVELFRRRRNGLAHRLPSDPQRREAGDRDQQRFEVEALPLSANFRSEAPVIGAVNEIGRQFEELVSSHRTGKEPGGKTGGTRHEFKELRVGVTPGADGPDANPALAPRVELLLTEAEVWQDVDLGPLAPRPGEHQHVTKSRGQHEAEALVLAWHVRTAIEDGVPPGDIVVLLRTKTRMWMFEEALKQVGVRPYVVGGTGFWETREGVDLRSLLATVANPLDDESLSGTLAGPACGISPSALWLLARERTGDQPLWPRLELLADQGITGIDDSDRDLAKRFVNTVRDLQTRRAGLSLAELVKAVVAETGYDMVSAVRDPSGAGLANIRRVAEIAGEYEATEGRDLRGLVSWIEDSSRIDSEQAIATEDEDSDVVRLMTIHKSKGLEFPMVCVADLGRGSKSDSESVIWVSPRVEEPGQFEIGLCLPDPGKDNLELYDWPAIKERAKEDTADEELRILHVALTRARKRLVLSGVACLEKVPGLSESRSAATRLTQAFGVEELEDGIRVPAAESIEGADFELADSMIEVKLVRPEDSDGLDEVTEITPPVAEASGAGMPPIERPPAAAFPQVPLSYSALAAYRECPARFFAARVLKLDPPEPAGAPRAFATEPLDPEMGQRTAVDATAFGLAVHELLEAMPARKWRMPGDAAIGRVLARFGAGSADDLELAREMLNDFIDSDLGRQVISRRADVEASLLVEIDGVMVRGYADLLLHDSERPMVLDYKSNQLEGTSIDELMTKYDLQRDLYALAVSQALHTDEVDTAFVFLRRPAAPVIDRFDRDRLDQARTAITALVGDIARGQYFGGSAATHHPCGDCWACELLAGQIDVAGGGAS